MAPKVTASEMMNNHITNFLCGMANAGASRSSWTRTPVGAANLTFASLTVPPERLRSHFNLRSGCPQTSYGHASSVATRSNSYPQQSQQIQPKHTHEVPVLRGRIQRALGKYRAM